MGEDLLTSLSMENHHPSTLLSMDSGPISHDELDRELIRPIILSRPPDINLPLAAQPWISDPFDVLDVGLGAQVSVLPENTSEKSLYPFSKGIHHRSTVLQEKFIKEISLPMRIPGDAKLQVCGDEMGTGFEIVVTKHRVGSQECDARVCLQPHLGANELVFS